MKSIKKSIGRKKGEFNFNILFAIIAGGAILVLAIYGAVKIGNTQRFQTDTEIAKKLSILTNPLQSGPAAGKYGKISFKQETKINNYCYIENSGEFSGFGRNELSVSTKSSIGEEWQEAGKAIPIKNKYIFSQGFSDEQDKGSKDFYVFSQPFKFPYKVSDLTVFIPSNDEYCFINPPEEIEQEILSTKIPVFEITNTGNCSSNYLKVCFDYSSDCDMSVRGLCDSDCENVFEEGYVEKNLGSESIRNYYVDNLLYAALFSDNQIYECNVKRLLYRTGQIAGIYAEKASLMQLRSCNSNLQQSELRLFSDASLSATVLDLISLKQIAKNIDDQNEQGSCELF